MLDTGTLANFVTPEVAERYRDTCQVQPWVRRIRTGDTSLGASVERIQLRITRERGSVQVSSLEWFIVFATGFDAIVGLPALERWGWVQWGDVLQTQTPVVTMATSAAFLTVDVAGDYTGAESLGIQLFHVSDRSREATSAWHVFPELPTTGGKAGLRPTTAHRVLSDDRPEDDFWTAKRARRRQEVSDAQWLQWQTPTFWNSRGLELRTKKKKGGLGAP